jgi:hypothetical protein
MTQIRKRIKTIPPSNDFERSLEQELLSFSLELSGMLNGGLKFSDNHNAQTVAVADTGSANAEFTVAHSLKRIPVGFIIVRRTGFGVVYESGTDWTAAAIYLKCTTANNNISVFVF